MQSLPGDQELVGGFEGDTLYTKREFFTESQFLGRNCFPDPT